MTALSASSGWLTSRPSPTSNSPHLPGSRNSPSHGVAELVPALPPTVPSPHVAPTVGSPTGHSVQFEPVPVTVPFNPPRLKRSRFSSPDGEPASIATGTSSATSGADNDDDAGSAIPRRRLKRLRIARTGSDNEDGEPISPAARPLALRESLSSPAQVALAAQSEALLVDTSASPLPAGIVDVVNEAIATSFGGRHQGDSGATASSSSHRHIQHSHHQSRPSISRVGESDYLTFRSVTQRIQNTVIGALGGPDPVNQEEIKKMIGRGRCSFTKSFDPPATILESNPELKTYQVAAVHWLRTLFDNSLNGLIADDMGLGKSAECICFLNRLYAEERLKLPTVIACPATLVDNWCDELRKWAPRIRFLKYHGSRTYRRYLMQKFETGISDDELQLDDENNLSEIDEAPMKDNSMAKPKIERVEDTSPRDICQMVEKAEPDSTLAAGRSPQPDLSVAADDDDEASPSSESESPSEFHKLPEDGGCAYHVVVTTHQTLANTYDRQFFFKVQSFGYLVVDEAHSLKNSASQRYQHMNKSIRAVNRLLLTGSPVQNQISELKNLLAFLNPYQHSPFDIELALQYHTQVWQKAMEKKQQAAVQPTIADPCASEGTQADKAKRSIDTTAVQAQPASSVKSDSEAPGTSQLLESEVESEATGHMVDVDPSAHPPPETKGSVAALDLASTTVIDGDSQSSRQPSTPITSGPSSFNAAVSHRDESSRENVAEPALSTAVASEEGMGTSLTAAEPTGCGLARAAAEVILGETQVLLPLQNGLDAMGQMGSTDLESAALSRVVGPDGEGGDAVHSETNPSPLPAKTTDASGSPLSTKTEPVMGGTPMTDDATSQRAKKTTTRMVQLDGDETIAFSVASSVTQSPMAGAGSKQLSSSSFKPNSKESDPEILFYQQLLAPLILRRLKAEVIDNFPQKTNIIERCDMVSLQRELYNAELLAARPALADVTISGRRKRMRQPRQSKDATSDGAASALTSQPEKKETPQNFIKGLLFRLRRICNHPVMHQRHFTMSQRREFARFLKENSSDYRQHPFDKIVEHISDWSDFDIHCEAMQFLPATKRFRLPPELLLKSCKVLKMLELIDKLCIEQSEKVLIFSQFTAYLNVIQEVLNVHRPTVPYLRLDGSTAVEERSQVVATFQDVSSHYKIFLLSTKAGGVGLNLTTAKTVILMDQDWNPHNDRQAEDRVHRLGQKEHVTIYRLCCRHSFEETILSCCKKKLELDEAFGGSADNLPLEIFEDIIRTVKTSAAPPEAPVNKDKKQGESPPVSEGDEKSEKNKRSESKSADATESGESALIGPDDDNKEGASTGSKAKRILRRGTTKTKPTATTSKDEPASPTAKGDEKNGAVGTVSKTVVLGDVPTFEEAMCSPAKRARQRLTAGGAKSTAAAVSRRAEAKKEGTIAAAKVEKRTVRRSTPAKEGPTAGAATKPENAPPNKATSTRASTAAARRTAISAENRASATAKTASTKSRGGTAAMKKADGSDVASSGCSSEKAKGKQNPLAADLLLPGGDDDGDSE